MTIAGRRPATELGLRPAPPNRDSSPRLSGLVVLALFLLGMLIGLFRLAGPVEELYPVTSDSEKYHEIAQGFAELYSHPIDGIRLWLSGSVTETDLERYGFNSWVLQHAPAYTALLGFAYLFPGDDIWTGRFVTVVLFALGGAFLYLLGREMFGAKAGLGAALIYLFWPAQWTYAPAILTEIPVTAAAIGTSYILLRTARSGGPKGWIFGGAMIGTLVLTKTTLRYLAVPMIVLEFFIDRAEKNRVRLRRMGARLAGWGVTQAIWLLFLWGFQLSANPMAGTGDDWLWIYRGNYVPDRGWETVGLGDTATPELKVAIEKARSVPQQERRETIYKEAFFETLNRHPGGMATLVLAKAGIFWRFPAVKTDVRAGPLELPPPARVQPAIAIAALLGFVLCLGSGTRRCLPAAIPLYLTLLHAATHLVSRYNIPALPFAFVYGTGAVGACIAGGRELVRRSGADWWKLGGKGSERLVALAAALAAIIIAVLALRVGGLFSLVGPWIAALGAIPILKILLADRGRMGLARSLVLMLPLAMLTWGALASQSDPDAGRITLRRPGEGVRLALSLPEAATPQQFVEAAFMIDMLPSEKGRVDLSVRISGSEIARINGRPPSGPEAFKVDEEVHVAGDRYKRVLRSLERHLNGHVRKRSGMSKAGYDFYRQWYEIPLDPTTAFADTEPVLEIVLLDAEGGSVDLFVDRDAPARGYPERVIEMPAWFVNPYELSNYRFDALATDRILADARLTRPITVASARKKAEFVTAEGEIRPLKGEPRLRLRGRLPGGWALTQNDRGETVPAFVSDSTRVIRMLEPGQIRLLQSDRDNYFDGFITF